MFMQGIDDAVVSHFAAYGPDHFCYAFFPFFTSLGNFGQIWIAIGLLLIATRKYRAWGIAALIALASSFVLDELILKHLFMRARPFIADSSIQILIDPPYGTSFPSGHSATALAFASCLMLSNLRIAPKLGVLALALLMAYTRVHLCVHYLSDVLIGALVGVAVGVIVGLAANALIKRRKRNNPPIVLERGATNL